MKIRISGVVCACAIAVVSPLTQALPASGQGTWESTLQGRDLDGNVATYEAYYDTTLDITWLADANYAGSSMGWDDANAWAAGLNPYGSGITNWRLPTASPINGVNYVTGFNKFTNGQYDSSYNVSAPGSLYEFSTASELAYLFFNTLGNQSAYELSGAETGCGGFQMPSCLVNTGPFADIKDVFGEFYWTGSEMPNGYILDFYMVDGRQHFHLNNGAEFKAWAVHDGDVGVSAVPVPAAAWLFGSGLLGLAGLARRKKAA